MLWIVHKGNYTTENIVWMGGYNLIPLLLFFLGNYERRCDISWRNFMLSRQPGCSGTRDSEPSIPGI
jgi:hypothetical protein